MKLATWFSATEHSYEWYNRGYYGSVNHDAKSGLSTLHWLV